MKIITKNLLVAALLISGTAQASAPKSNGRDLNCRGDAFISTPYYTCNTPYGISHTCTKNELSFSFRINPLKGDLRNGLSGNLIPSDIYDLESSKGTADMKAMLVTFVKNSSGFVSYKDQNISMILDTPVGRNTSHQKLDLSAGKSSVGVYISLPNSNEYGAVPVKNPDLMIGMTIFCVPSTDL